MTTSFPFLLLLLFSVSLHACTARSRSLALKDTANYHFYKELDMVKLPETTTCERCNILHTSKEMIVVGAASGTSFKDSPSFLAAKKAMRGMVAYDKRKHGRSMLEPVEVAEISNAGDTAEDIVEMDYAQPHRKPPIHNQKP